MGFKNYKERRGAGRESIENILYFFFAKQEFV
jgi:endonuclease III-like uncharacterized protein